MALIVKKKRGPTIFTKISLRTYDLLKSLKLLFQYLSYRFIITSIRPLE